MFQFILIVSSLCFFSICFLFVLFSWQISQDRSRDEQNRARLQRSSNVSLLERIKITFPFISSVNICVSIE